MSIVVFPEDPTTKNKRLKFEERQAIADWLLKESKEGKLKYGSLKQASILFNKSRRTISRIWKQCKSSVDNGTPLDVSSKLVGRVGRKRVEVDINQVKEIPLCRRTNIRSLAFAMNMAKSTVFRRIKDGTIRTHTNSIKPQLTEQNKKVRLEFCFSMLDQSTIQTNPKFVNMFNYVHIDEKWFFLSKKSERYYLLPEEHEPDPYRSCKSKNFIPKVMFMAVVARPRFDENGIELFSGKIGIFPFVVKEPAKRNSKNRTAGTLETKPILSVTKDITRACLIEKVLPAIRSKWPASDSNIPICIQQDNARPHIGVNDLEFVEAAQKDGFDIKLCFQPPNSPDLNALDLGFFRAIQSLQYQKAPSNVDELVEAVERSFDEMKVEQLNHVFLTLQSCMIEVMKDNGGNNYKVPHLNKNRLEREDNLPLQLCCDIGIVNHVSTLLQQ
ncbi:uncharacterized protein LOC125864031 [Solanum stenotomum]|nr:uncharacterized protein LOC125852932 [Solanum stenotomum]XP_049389234.1 uncharacterized protein LOC125853559 [Solanum stenotomum]XP_049399938.1 uncharacterized protein LOC125864031 [Solanum stenotomum]